jgi:pimeloyl-ACP methyl ester carboxylesterase
MATRTAYPTAATSRGVASGVGVATVVALGVAALSGVVASLFMPRGPTTTGQALVLMAAALGVGVLAGYRLRSRWALLLVPVLHVVAFEVARMGAVGPTVDLPRFDTAFGVLAFVLGRGVYAVVCLVPMAIGAGIGVAAARRVTGARTNWLRSALAVLCLIALALWLNVPARTPLIVGADGAPVPGSIAELSTVRIGGHDQSILIRGHDVTNPVLLYLSGGPGQSDLPFSRLMLAGLAESLVVVSWDQRGTGTSYAALEPTSTLTLERAVADTLELTDYLRDRFGEEKIYLLGESWGTILGVLAVQQRPDLFHAYLGSGQMVNVSVTDRIIWRDLLDYAQESGDWRLYDRVLTMGEPPYRDTPWSNAFVMTQYEKLYGPYTPPAAYLERASAGRLGFSGVLGSEYTLIDKANVVRGLLDTFAIMYPQLQQVDLRVGATRLDVPIYLLDGQAELRGRRDLALEWFDALDAPLKRLYSFENAAHAVAFEQFEALEELMEDVILPETYAVERSR